MINDKATSGSDYRSRIATDSEILGGKPVVKGTRIPVSLVLNLLVNGYSFERIVEAYPILTLDDIRAAIAYAGARLEIDESRSMTSIT